ncbi:LADA_0H13498g1_1 [Lachancea dasiensis]|uniref:LADA_0H13498g1_1 n=1 Tax=Lachancea dasiensis TaxID=1072105 RepID=A0A1G4K446_9SACH|nr:LADA_0H13498g1_1 [Lachancea dasiensis]
MSSSQNRAGLMSQTVNTRKFVRIVRDELVKKLNVISNGENPQILVLQAHLVPYVSNLCTFSQLTDSTAVAKIVVHDSSCRANLEELIAETKYQLVFAVDVRSDLQLPSEFCETIQSLDAQAPHLLYVTWETEPSNTPSKLPHFLSLQLKGAATVLPWFVVPTCMIDDNLLMAGVLYNSDGENLYMPRLKSMQKATRGILMQNLSNALQSLLEKTGLTITHACSFGKDSHLLVDHLKRDVDSRKTETDVFLDQAMYGARHSGLQCDLVVIEREMDLVTPLLSQLTYGGILDDLYEINDRALINAPDLADVEVISLNYTKDEVWDELKFKNFGALGPRLNEMARGLQAEYDARHQAESVGEIKQFVENLSSLQERQKFLKLHTALSSKVVSEVTEKDAGEDESMFNRILELEQDMIAGNLSQRSTCEKILELLHEGQVSYRTIVKLCCIFSLTRNGIRDREYGLLRTEIVDAWGAESMFDLQRLARAGMLLNKQLFAEYSPWRDFDSFAKYLDLIPQVEEETDPGNPSESSFAYCGTVPILTRAIQLLFDRSVVTKTFSSQQPFIISRSPSWRGLEEIFSQHYGPGILRNQVWDGSTSPRTKIIGKPAKGAVDPVLVAVLGGVTVGEMATLQFLADQLRQKGIYKRFIVVADGIAGGPRFLGNAVAAPTSS